MNIELDRHRGLMKPDGTVIVYNVMFHNVIQALRFLRRYPVGPDYEGSYTPYGQLVFIPKKS